jgi:hypothetical protein
LSSEPKHLKLVFKREYTPLDILLLLPILVGAEVVRVGAASTISCRGRAATVACLPTTAESVLMRLAAAALAFSMMPASA